jgi:hypothetical protein
MQSWADKVGAEQPKEKTHAQKVQEGRDREPLIEALKEVYAEVLTSNTQALQSSQVTLKTSIDNATTALSQMLSQQGYEGMAHTLKLKEVQQSAMDQAVGELTPAQRDNLKQEAKGLIQSLLPDGAVLNTKGQALGR